MNESEWRRSNEHVLKHAQSTARRGEAVLAGKALSRKVAFELDLKGLARLSQAEEGKNEKKNSMRKSMEAGKHVSQWGTGRMWYC